MNTSSDEETRIYAQSCYEAFIKFVFDDADRKGNPYIQGVKNESVEIFYGTIIAIINVFSAPIGSPMYIMRSDIGRSTMLSIKAFGEKMPRGKQVYVNLAIEAWNEGLKPQDKINKIEIQGQAK